MPKTIFYARVSTRDQNPALQIDAAKTLDVKTGDIFVEKASGSRDRPVLAKALAACEKGDTLACWKLDRVGRSVTHLSKLLADLEARGVHFRTIEDGLDTRGSTGKLVLHMLGAVAQFERDLIIERTKAGLAIARKNGKRLGPPIAGHGEAGQEVDEVRRAELSGSRQHVECFSPDAISRLEGCARARRAFRGVTMRILICGGRQFEDAGFLWQAMDELHAKTPITEVIVGGAAGADTLGEQWAKDRRIPYRIFLADWATHGRAAGPIRNKAMLDEGSRIWSSFPGGRGTANMLKQARAAGDRVWQPGSRSRRLGDRLPRRQLGAKGQKMNLEGIVSKRKDSAYRSGLTRDWLKIKTTARRTENRGRWELFETKRQCAS